MEKTIHILAFISSWCSINALFTVEVPQSVCVAQYGSTVNMTCTFPVAESLRMKDLKVYWHQISSSSMAEKEIYALDGGKENLTLQHVSYRGRATLLKDKLYKGQAVLQITNMKLTDAGSYRCLIIYGGADHKKITLQVKAPFRKIDKFEKTISVSEQEERDLICQSEGYPIPEVMWHNKGQDVSNKASTSYEINAEQLYKVTTVLRINATGNTTYHCIFWNKDLQENTSESFSFSDKLEFSVSPWQKPYYGIMLAVCIFAVLSMALFIWMQKNGQCRTPATLCANRKHSMSYFACKRNPSNHIWKFTRNFCLPLYHTTDKRITTEDHSVMIPIDGALEMPLSMDVKEASERLHIPSKENRTEPPPEAMNEVEVEVDVHCDQELVVKET